MMKIPFFKKSKALILFFVVFSAITLTVFYQLLKVDKKLKIYNPVDVNPRLVDSDLRFIKKDHKMHLSYYE